MFREEWVPDPYGTGREGVQITLLTHDPLLMEEVKRETSTGDSSYTFVETEIVFLSNRHTYIDS